jgi:hypothetical protein
MESITGLYAELVVADKTRHKQGDRPSAGCNVFQRPEMLAAKEKIPLHDSLSAVRSPVALRKNF